MCVGEGEKGPLFNGIVTCASSSALLLCREPPALCAPTYQQRYYVCGKQYWKPNDLGDPGPIFLYAGNEADVLLYLNNSGLMWENAPKFGALLVFAEHRYRVALSAVLWQIDALLLNKKQPTQPAVPHTFGGSYGGMLAAWMRMKYPATIDGAIAASAPIWNFEGEDPPFDPTSFAKGVSYDASPEGGKFVTAVLPATQAVLQGLARLRQELPSTDTYPLLPAFIRHAKYILNGHGELPAFPVRVACEHLADPQLSGRRLLEGMAMAAGVFYNYSGSLQCFDYNEGANKETAEVEDLWDYQYCTEMFMPFGKNGGTRTDMGGAEPWDPEAATAACKEQWGVTPRRLWATEEWGGKKIGALKATEGKLIAPARTRGARLIQVEPFSFPATGRGSGYKQAHNVGERREGRHTSEMRVVCTFGTLCQQEALGHLGEKCRSYDQTIPTCAGRAKGAVREGATAGKAAARAWCRGSGGPGRHSFPHPRTSAQSKSMILLACIQSLRRVKSTIAGKAPVMGRKPLGLMASGRIHTWLPQPTQQPPDPETLASLPNKKIQGALQCQGPVGGSGWGWRSLLVTFLDSSWPQPASLSSALKLGVLTKQILLPGLPNFGGLGCSGQSLEAKIPKVLSSTFPARPPQASGPAPDNTNFISILLWMLLPGPGPGSGTISQETLQSMCGPFQLAAGPLGSGCNWLFNLYVSAIVSSALKVERGASKQWLAAACMAHIQPCISKVELALLQEDAVVAQGTAC
eukprot:1144009-Pelagomonas_calceolata.AAC.3